MECKCYIEVYNLVDAQLYAKHMIKCQIIKPHWASDS